MTNTRQGIHALSAIAPLQLQVVTRAQ